MKNSNDTIGNRTSDLPVCSAVLQPTASPRTPSRIMFLHLFGYFQFNVNPIEFKVSMVTAVEETVIWDVTSCSEVNI